MQFENTYQFIWLLLLLPAGAVLYAIIRWKQQVKEKLGDSRLTTNLFSAYSPEKFLLKGICLLAVLVLLTLALVNLRRPDATGKVKLSGTDLMIALDVSNSMLAGDIQPSRLEKAKLLVGKLIDQLQGNRIGLVVFAGNAYLQMPLTTDASAARIFLSSISPGMVPYQGTNISEALQLCDRSMNTQEKKYKSILLISDGEDHDKTTLETAEKLKQNGIIINTIGIGSPQGSTIIDPVTNEPRRDEQGNIVISKLNQADLQKIAAATNGTYMLLSDATAAANEIAQQLGQMDQKPITDTALTNFSSYYFWFVLAAALLLVLDIVMSETKTRRNMTKPASLLFVLFLSAPAFAQKDNQQQVRKGNEAYRKQDFTSAAKDYEDAVKTGGSTTAGFNLGNTKFKTGKFDEAAKQYESVTSASSDKKLQAQSLYNKGLSQVRQKKLDEAIQSFKQSLRLNPNDEETRDNLQKALNEKKQQDQQQQKKDDKKEDKKDDKKNDKKDSKDQGKKDKDNQDKKDNPNQDKQQQQPKISRQEAEQKLQALRQEEKKVQQKLNDKQPTSMRQPEKDW